MRISVTVGSRRSDAKYAWQHLRSSRSIARPSRERKAERPASSKPRKPCSVSTGAGGSSGRTSVSGLSRLASRLSTGLMT